MKNILFSFCLLLGITQAQTLQPGSVSTRVYDKFTPQMQNFASVKLGGTPLDHNSQLNIEFGNLIVGRWKSFYQFEGLFVKFGICCVDCPQEPVYIQSPWVASVPKRNLFGLRSKHKIGQAGGVEYIFSGSVYDCRRMERRPSTVKLQSQAQTILLDGTMAIRIAS